MEVILHANRTQGTRVQRAAGGVARVGGAQAALFLPGTLQNGLHAISRQKQKIGVLQGHSEQRRSVQSKAHTLVVAMHRALSLLP